MKHLKTHYLTLRLLIAVMALGMMFLPGTAFAQDSTSTTSSTTMASTSSTSEPGDLPAFPAVTELPLLGSNITIELGTDENGLLASVTVDGELADFELEQEDGEIKIEFTISNESGDFEVEVKFEDDDVKIEIEAQGPTAPGDYVWAGETCDGGEFSIAYTVAEDGTLVLGAVAGDVTRTEVEGDELEIRFADGTRVEFQMDDDALEIEQSCHEPGSGGFDDESDDDSDDHDSDGDDHDSDDHDTDGDDHDSDDDDHDDDEDDESDDDDHDDDEDDESDDDESDDDDDEDDK